MPLKTDCTPESPSRLYGLRAIDIATPFAGAFLISRNWLSSVSPRWCRNAPQHAPAADERKLGGGDRAGGADALKELEAENAKLKKPLAESELDKAALKDLLNCKW